MLSLVVSVRNWPNARLESCVRSFSALPPDIVDEIVVVDFGSASPVPLAPGDRVRVVRLEAERWSLAESTNAGVLAARNDLIAKTDADIIIDPRSVDGLRQASIMVRDGHYNLLHTEMVDLPPHLSLDEAEKLIAVGDTPAGRLRPRWGQGSLPIFRKQTWASVGGYDSRLTGWGSEDNDFSDRIRRSGARIGWMPPGSIRLFHVWHAPAANRVGVGRQSQANRALVDSDRSIYRPMRFMHSDISPVAAPHVIRAAHPLVTIAIATAARSGRERMLAEAITSFRGQADSDFEVVVVDNGSSDEEHAALRGSLAAFSNQMNLRVERLSERSIPKARNEISRIARGKYICVADDDDLALPNRLRDHLRPFEIDGLAHGSYGGWIDFDAQTGLIEKNSGKVRTISTLLKGVGKITNHPSSLYRTDVIRALPYDEAMQFGSDWDLALRAGAMGLRFSHTGTFVTLRRFHGANVTLTDSSEQVTTGLRSRSRTWGLYNSRHQAGHIAAAAREAGYLACSNEMSTMELLAFLPAYVGQWRLTLPFAQLSGDGEDGQPLVAQLVELVDGDLGVLRSGADPEVMFISEVLDGAAEVLRLVDTIAAQMGLLPDVVSDRQLQLDRAAAFEWTSLGAPSGDAMLISDRFGDVADALDVLTEVSVHAAEVGSARLVADHDKDGPAHYLVFPSTHLRSEARRVLARLSRIAATRFRFTTMPSAPSIPLQPTDRFH